MSDSESLKVQVVLNFPNLERQAGETVWLDAEEAALWISRRLASPVTDASSNE